MSYRGDGKHFVMRADEKLTAFVEPEAAIEARQCIKSNRLIRADLFPLVVSRLSGGR
jgi:hypothetical protein